MKKVMKALAAIMLMVVIVCFAGCGETDTEANRKARQYRSETSYPEEYLKIERATLQEKLLSFVNNKAIIEGTIHNTATMAKYKDIVLIVHYYSKTKTEIRSDSFVIYEYISPNGYLPFKLEVVQPDNYKSFHVEVFDASTVYQ